MFSVQIQQWNEVSQKLGSVDSLLLQSLQFAREYRDKESRRLSVGGTIDGQPYSLDDAVAFAGRAISAVRAIRPTKNTPVPTGPWNNLIAAIGELDRTAGALAAQTQTIRLDGRPLTIASGSSLKLDSGETAFDLAPPTSAMVGAVDGLLSACATILPVSRASALGQAPGPPLVVDDAKAAEAALENIERSSRKSAEALTRATSSAEQVSELQKSLSGALVQAKTDVSGRLNELTEALQKIKDTSTAANSDAAVAASKLEDIKKLESQARDAQAQIAAFGSTLDDTRRRLDSQVEESKSLIADFSSQQSRVTQLIADAEKMLSGATVSGLAKAFAEERNSLDRSLFGALVSFLLGIFLLGATAIFLAAYVLNIQIPFFTQLSQHSAAHPGQQFEPTLAGVLSRGLILMAPFWLTLFSARRYRSIFDLRQQYSHKYNMAFSVEGFKTQAPQYAESIAAWVFKIVAESPMLQKPGTAMDETPPTGIPQMVDLITDSVKRAFGQGGAQSTELGSR